MATHDGAPEAIDPDAWLTAERIAELSCGQVKANTVRGWWRSGALEYRVFPELGVKSNRRTHRSVAEQFIQRKFGTTSPAAVSTQTPAHATTPPPARVADLLDTLASLKAAADATMQALITEAEQHAQMAAAQAAISRAQADADAIRAEADAIRVDTLRHLQTSLRGYDQALTTLLQPGTPAAAFAPAEQ